VSLQGHPERVVIDPSIVNVFIFFFLEKTDHGIGKRGEKDLHGAFEDIVGDDDSNQDCGWKGTVKSNEAENDGIQGLSNEG